MPSYSLVQLPNECFFSILSFLDFPEIFSLKELNHDVYNLLKTSNYLWLEFINKKLVQNQRDLLQLKNCLKIEELLKLIYKSKSLKTLYSLGSKAVKVSSQDQPKESPQNIISIQSKCFSFLKSNHNIVDLDPLELGLQLQLFYCHCARGEPCYWSSASSLSNDSIDFIQISLNCSVALISGFCVTPYQAFFHVGAPIYAPHEVALQILSPDTSNTPELPTTVNYRDKTTDIEANVYYQSEFYPVTQTAELQSFIFPEPILSIGGQVRLILKGKYQRQPIDIPDSDGYYVCLSYVNIFGVQFPEVDYDFDCKQLANQRLIQCELRFPDNLNLDRLIPKPRDIYKKK